MANHKEILRLKSLGLTHAQIAQSCECGRNTVTRTLQQAQSAGLSWSQARNMTEEEISAKLYPKAPYSSAYQMPDYEYIHQEMQSRQLHSSLPQPLSSAVCARARRSALPRPSPRYSGFTKRSSR